MREYFPRLIGNSQAKARIGSAIEAKTVPHAFLIGGPSGSGKSVMATEIAMALNCENSGMKNLPLPCGVCNNCKRILEGTFTDVKILEKKKDKSTLGVSEIKDFREEQPLNARLEIFKSLTGRSTVASERQPSKSDSSISAIFAGSLTSSSEKQEEKAQSSIKIQLSGTEILDKLKQ